MCWSKRVLSTVYYCWQHFQFDYSFVEILLFTVFVISLCFKKVVKCCVPMFYNMLDLL